MHDKFLVDRTGGRVLAGSANFTPEVLTSPANLLHIFNSAELADLYAARAELMHDDPTIAETAKGADWSDEIKVGAARIRVFFSPEPNKQRVSIDTVVDAVKAARSSVIFCMFDPTDPALLKALMATSDRGKLLYGLLNSISDPSTAKKPKAERDDENRAASGLPPKNPTAATQVRVEVFNRSRKDKSVIAYNYFRPKAAPAGFLPEFSTVDLSSKNMLGQHKASGKRPPPAVHIHHKFIVIDADTEAPTIYSGSRQSQQELNQL